MDSQPNARVCIIGSAAAETVAALGGGQEPPLTFDEPGASLGALAGQAIAAVGPDRDVVLVHGAVPPPTGEWLSALTAAARSPLAAAAVALTVADLPATRLELDDPPHPRVPASASPVVLLTRSGLALIGAPDSSIEDWAAIVTDVVQRAVRAGLVVVAAGDLVAPADGAPGGAWLDAVVAEAARTASPQARARARARRAVQGLSVTLDCRSLGPSRMGTQTHALGLALALGAHAEVRLRCLVAHDLAPEVESLLLSGPRTTLLTYEDALQPVAPTAIVHRPQQVNTIHDLALLQPLGERLVVTHQDLIGYRNPAYHADVAAWLRHRRETRYALELADRVLFLSEHARSDALAEDVVDPAWTEVVGIGVDLKPAEMSVRPPEVPDTADLTAGFLLHLGTDLRHKNRPFALSLLKALRARGWNGALVVAGADQQLGGTRADEDAMLRADRELASHVHRLGIVSEPEKSWLLAHAAAVVYPTVDEGFGLLPFEGAAAGTPVAHAGSGGLTEALCGGEQLLVAWDPERSAERLLPVLTDCAVRERHVAATRRAAERHTWQATADRTVAAYETALRSPRRAIGWHAVDRLATEAELADLRGHAAGLEAEVGVLRAFRAAVGEDGARLVGHHALLSAQDRRALLAVLTRPALCRPLLALMRAGYRAGRNR